MLQSRSSSAALPVAGVPNHNVIDRLEDKSAEREAHAVSLEVVTQRDRENALHDAGALCALVPLLAKCAKEGLLVLQNDLKIKKKQTKKRTLVIMKETHKSDNAKRDKTEKEVRKKK